MTFDVPFKDNPWREARALLYRGGVVALPTDTLYALSAVATDAAAVRRVYAIKGREYGKPLPLFVANEYAAGKIAHLNDTARVLIRQFWPGGLTIVLPKQYDFESEAIAGGDTVAVRAPAREEVLRTMHTIGYAPITGTSANRSGGTDPDTADEVRRQIGDEVDFIVDGGRCPGGVSSTIVDCTGDEIAILRHGAIPENEIRAALAMAML